VNIGMAARACRNCGVTDLALVEPGCAIDCADARRFANHARDFLLAAPVHASLDEAVADCGLVIGTAGRPRDDARGQVLAPEDLPELLRERPAHRFALVFGNEADGLNNDELRRCQCLLTLAMPGDYQSFNLSHAVAITLYMAAAARVAPLPREPLAERRQVNQLMDYWMDTLERIRYFRRTKRERWVPRFERVLDRMPLTAHDISVLWGMLAQVNYHAFGAKDPAPRADEDLT